MAQAPRGPRKGAQDQGAFAPPPAPTEAAEGFASPNEKDEGAGFGTEAVDAELLSLKEELEKKLFACDNGGLKSDAAGEALQGADNIVGLGIGPAMRDFESVGSKGPGAPVLNVYVAQPMTMDEAKPVLVDEFGARALASDGEPVNVIRTGIIDAFSHRHRERPAPFGISLGPMKVTAGMLGALARRCSGKHVQHLLLLCNTDVLATANEARIADSISQSDAFDGGRVRTDRVAILECWVRPTSQPPASMSSIAPPAGAGPTGWARWVAVGMPRLRLRTARLAR